jgi:DNA (cytosine-5)-methyltransferase 1
MTLTVGSLFSGIGGIDLGLERAGMKVRWQSEIDPYACRVLQKHWPDIPNLGNVKTVDWSTIEPVNVIAGGYPCQPFSTAGKRLGEKDERHLWPYFLRAISELRPRFAIMENVRGHLSMGFGKVLGDLAEVGYDAEWRLVSAAGMGAPHRRERILVVAYPTGQFSHGVTNNPRNSTQPQTACELGNGGRSPNVADGDDRKLGDLNNRGINQGTNEKRPKVFVSNSSGVSNNRTFVNWLFEPDVGRVAHGVSARVDRLRGLGNAVVPQVAEYVGRLILDSLNELEAPK